MVEKSEIVAEVGRFSANEALRRLWFREIGAIEAVKPVEAETAVGKPPSLRRRKPSSTEKECESRCSVVDGGEGESTLPTKWTEVVDGPASGR